jgi:hypothetical protein
VCDAMDGDAAETTGAWSMRYRAMQHTHRAHTCVFDVEAVEARRLALLRCLASLPYTHSF